MRYVYGIILFISSILAFYFSTRIFYRSKKEPHIIAFSITAFGSAIWSLGYGLMELFDNLQVFFISRVLGIAGLIIFISSSQFMICIIAKLSKKWFNYFTIESIIGFIVIVLVSNPFCVKVINTENGIITEFVYPILSIVYTVFIIIAAIGFIVVSLEISKTKYKKHIRVFSRNSLYIEAFMVAGIIIDTVLPALGHNYGIPASSMLQFVGLEILYYAVHAIDRNRINFQNMTGYITKSLKSPILVFGLNNELMLANDSAKTMFGFSDLDMYQIDFWNTYLGEKAPDNIIEL